MGDNSIFMADNNNCRDFWGTRHERYLIYIVFIMTESNNTNIKYSISITTHLRNSISLDFLFLFLYPIS